MKKLLIIFLALLFVTTTNLSAQVEYRFELVDLRSSNRKVYDLGNDKYRFEYYTSPIHYISGSNYVEYNQDLILDNKTNKYTTTASNYTVAIPTTETVNDYITLDYFGRYKIDIDYNTHSVTELHTKGSVKATFVTNSTNSLTIQPKNDKLKETLEIESPKSNRDFSYTIHTDELSFDNRNDINYLVNERNVAIYSIDDYYLIDSVGNVSTKVKTAINEVSKSEYRISLILDDDFLDNENIVYPVNLVGGVVYAMTSQSDVIRDKTIVKNTYEGYDGDILTVAKQTYYPFQNTPVYLSEYHSYSIMELNFDDLVGTNITVLEADLYLNRDQSNVNAKLKLSKITSSNYDDIDGFESYTTTLISQPFLSSDFIVYDITDEVEDHIDNSDTSLLLELSPQFISLGTSSIKYMNFVSTNANEYTSPYLVIDVYGTITSDYGDAPDFYPTSNTGLNCFGYALRMTNTWINIDDTSGNQISFAVTDMSSDDLYSIIVPGVLYTIEDLGYDVRILSSGYADVDTDEYRIAFRIGNLSNTTGDGFILVPSGTTINNLDDDYHFMIQLEDGNWAEKQGSEPSFEFSGSDFPSAMDWNLYSIGSRTSYISNFYDSDTIYFAISRKVFEW